MPTTSDRLRKQARNVKKDLQKMADTARNGARKSIRQVGANASERYRQRRNKIHKIERGVMQTIRDRPLTSALIAAGIGLALGSFWIRRLTAALSRTKNAA